MRVTTNSTLDPALIKSVYRTDSGGYRLVMHDGIVRTYRRAQLTEEARNLFDEMVGVDTTGNP